MKQRIDHLIEELRSRSVFRATVAYCVVAWMLLQVADVTFDRLPIPDNSMTVLIVLVVLGLPITVILAWAYDITLRGIVRHGEKDQRAWRLAFVPFVLVVVTVSVAIGFGLYKLSLQFWDPAPQAIAVLPFTNMSGNEEDEYFSDGLTEEIQTLISRIGVFRVVSLNSTYQLKNTDLDYVTIARRLGVDIILHGSVRRAADQVRITARLTDGDDGTEAWSASFDSALANVFDIQEKIARQVAGALEVALPESADRQFEQLGTRSVEAYDLYLRGLDQLRKPKDASTLDEAEAYFRQAIAIDPKYARAYAALCESHLSMYEVSRDSTHFSDGERACNRALTRDNAAANVLAALGHLYYAAGEYDESLQQFDRALSVDLKYVDAHIGRGKALIELNRSTEAEQSLRQAIALDPSYWAGFNEMGSFLYSAGRFDEAADYYLDFARRSEDNATAYNNVGAAYYLAGNLSAAAEAWDRSLAIKPTRSAYSNTGTMYFYLGEFEIAAERFIEASKYAPWDHRLWGNLADAYYFTDGMQHVATAIYKAAIDFAEERIQVNPLDMETVAILAHYYARVGNDEKARQMSARALSGAPEDMYVQYYSALVSAQLGDTDNALARVERAIALDYKKDLLRFDPGLVVLAESERFKQLVEKDRR